MKTTLYSFKGSIARSGMISLALDEDVKNPLWPAFGLSAVRYYNALALYEKICIMLFMNEVVFKN